MTPEPNEYLSEALSNVDSLSFPLKRVLESNDAQRCYDRDFIRLLAVLPGSEVGRAERELKAKYPRDFKIPQWRSDIKEAKQSLQPKKESESPLITSANGNTAGCLANAVTKLRESPLTLSFNEFSSRMVHETTSPWGTRGDFDDYDAAKAAEYLQHNGVMVQSSIAREAALVVSHDRKIHPPRDFLNSLKWDGKPRVDRWMTDYLGGPDSELQWTISAAWTISAVGRIMRPGCIAKQMIVLEGPQNKGKSLALRAITNGHLDGDTGVQWFRDGMPEIDHKDIGQFMQGVWIIEIAELEAIRGKAWSRVKSFVSSPVDSFRWSFGHYLKDHPRSCIFAASTNEYQWGGDPSGLTRFWPFLVGKIEIDEILKNRDQIWAEAVHRYNAGERWRLSGDMEALAEQEQAERAPDDSLSERVALAIRKLKQFGSDDFSLGELMNAMNISGERQPAEQSRIGRALPGLGWTRVKVTKDGLRAWRYRLNAGHADEG